MLLSISIDLSRSTHTKSVIERIVQNEEFYNQTIEQYFRLLLNIETRLYFLSYQKKIDLTKLFLVKSIGDELWYVYDLGESADVRIIVDLIRILQDINSHVNRFLISEREVTWEEESANNEIWQTTPHETVYLPSKCHVDILKKFSNLTLERSEFVLKYLRGLMKNEKVEDVNDLFKKTVESLNLGAFTIQETRVRLENIRFDPVGIDVDLFFRCTKYSKPALVTVGDNLFQTIKKSINTSIVEVEVPNGPNSFRYERFPYIKKSLTPNDLKGIPFGYDIYYLPYEFCDNYFNKKTSVDDGCDETRRLLLDNEFIVAGSEAEIRYSRNKQKWFSV